MELKIAAIELEVLVDFLSEALEHLEGIEEKILQLENSQDLELVNSIFRPAHTIKGTASFLGLNDIKYLGHEIETLLDDLRNALISVTNELIDTLLDGVDVLAQMLKVVQNAINESDQTVDPVSLSIVDVAFEDNIAAINSLKKCNTIEGVVPKTPKEDQATNNKPSGNTVATNLLTADELKSIAYPMEMDISFVEESREHLENLEQFFLVLENDPGNSNLVDEIFRALHSLKGSAGVLISTVESERLRQHHPLTIFQNLAHASEGMVQEIRDQKTTITKAMIEILLNVVDRLNFMLKGFVDCDPTTAQAADLIELCRKESGGDDTDENVKEGVTKGQFNDGEMFALSNTISQSLSAIENGLQEIADDEKRDAALGKIGRSLKMIIKICQKLQNDSLSNSAEAILNLTSFLIKGKDDNEEIIVDGMAEDFKKMQVSLLVYVCTDDNATAQIPGNAAVAPTEPAVCLMQAEQPDVSAKKTSTSAANDNVNSANSTIKVPLERLNILMNLVGELIVSKSSFPEMAREITVDHNLKDLGKRVKNAGEQIGRVSDDLQNIVMEMRMLPVGTVFSKFKRLVRDLSKKLDKKISLQTSGEDTELDKTIIEILGDPLVHLIRNCADHALEKVEERRRVGKPDEGQILLKAYNQGQNVIIEIIDDGRGIDPDNIRVKAVEKGYLSLEELEQLDDKAVQNLVFRPGFSGAKEITDVSGRGVGMDVVRTNIEKIGGTVSLSSTIGIGTTFTLTLPLTLAVSKGLEVKAAGRHYYLPLDYIVETVKISPDLVRGHRDAQMAVIRNDLLPVFSLSSLLNTSGGDATALNSGADTNNELSMVVLNMNGKKAVLVVDKFYTESEYVIKPLTGNLSKIMGLSGATITNKGKVILILDPLKLF